PCHAEGVGFLRGDIQPDVVLTDIRMPGLTGVQAAAKICQDRPVPVLLMSARFEDELSQCAAADHIVGYLGKPLARANLKPAIDYARTCPQSRRCEQCRISSHHRLT